MEERQIKAGSILFSEGDMAENACIIVSGKVQLLEASQGIENEIGIYEAGSVVGELGIFDPSAMRPYTARAMEDTTITIISAEEFTALLSKAPAEIQPLLHVAISKMKATKIKSKLSQQTVLENNVSKIAFDPIGAKLKAQVKPFEISVSRLPFRIGGYPEGGEISRRDQLHLNIASQANPLRVSRQHCEIAVENKALIICDLASRFCTKVNGTIIGRGQGEYTAALHKGSNEIILSPMNEDYKFILQCE